MGQTDDEIYVTMVVVKRPPGSPDLNPACWADLIVSGLVPQGADHRAEAFTRRIARPEPLSGGVPHSAVRVGPAVRSLGRFKQRRPWLYLALSVLCFSMAVYLAQSLMH